VKIAGSTEALQGPTRRRSKSKREKDKVRQDTRDERKRLFSEAFHDNIDSIGEVDALTGSEALSIDRGNVLPDPETGGYRHPNPTPRNLRQPVLLAEEGLGQSLWRVRRDLPRLAERW
jgi:hypothetical protein